MPEYKSWLAMLESRLKYVDVRLTFTIDQDRPDPLNRALIINAEPHNAAVLKAIGDRAPNLAGWEFIIANK